MAEANFKSCEHSAGSIPREYKILADNMPGLEMLLVDKNLKIQCRLGCESTKQGWVNHTGNHNNLFEYFSEPIVKILRPLLQIAFEFTPVSREFSEADDHYSIRLVPFKADNSSISCVIIIQNITETKLVEEKLIISKKEAEQANEAKDNFIARMSHEIRTPLNAISGFAEQLKKTRLSKKQEVYLDAVLNSSRHLSTVIEDILVLSKGDAADTQTEEIPFRFSKVLKAVNELLMLKYQEKNLEYTSSFDLINDDVLIGDPSKLFQVLINLVSNAIKFTHQGLIQVNCKVIQRTLAGNTLLIEVQDSGIGISPEELDRIFRPFHQADKLWERNYSGSGLGLPISKDLIELMGGAINVKSKPGKGSVFSVVIPFKKAAPGVKPIYNEYFTPSVKPDLSFLDVLFVDDDPVNRLLGKAILEQFKAKTVFAASGREAIMLFNPGKFHLVLLDINMPGINGVDVALNIRNAEKQAGIKQKVKILAMTANALKKDVEQYIMAGVDNVILKPFGEQALLHKILELTYEVNDFHHVSPLQYPENVKDADFNLDQLLRITGGEKEFTIVMLNTFIDNTTTLLNTIRTAFSEDDYLSMAEAAHRLHPSTGQLGLKQATMLLEELERNCRNNNAEGVSARLVESITREVNNGLGKVDRARLSFYEL